MRLMEIYEVTTPGVPELLRFIENSEMRDVPVPMTVHRIHPSPSRPDIPVLLAITQVDKPREGDIKVSGTIIEASITSQQGEKPRLVEVHLADAMLVIKTTGDTRPRLQVSGTNSRPT